MDQFAGPGGFLMIFRFFRFLQYIPYIAIGLIVIAIVIWVVFAKKKLKWVKILAIVLTILAVFIGILGLATLFFGRNLPRGDFQEDFQRDRPNFQDRVDLNPDQNDQKLKIEFDDYKGSINKLSTAVV
jgi:hypothetical protein